MHLVHPFLPTVPDRMLQKTGRRRGRRGITPEVSCHNSLSVTITKSPSTRAPKHRRCKRKIVWHGCCGNGSSCAVISVNTSLSVAIIGKICQLLIVGTISIDVLPTSILQPIAMRERRSARVWVSAKVLWKPFDLGKKSQNDGRAGRINLKSTH
jgi:hypothetical protein